MFPKIPFPRAARTSVGLWEGAQQSVDGVRIEFYAPLVTSHLGWFSSRDLYQTFKGRF